MMDAQRSSANDDASEVDALREEVRKLRKINAALMDRADRSSELSGNAFSMFETAISLEAMVRARTIELEHALGRLNKANAALADAHAVADAAQMRLRDAIESINEGFALFDARDRLILCNEAYLSFWPEIAAHVEAQPTFHEIARIVAESRRPVGALASPDIWVSERLARHSVADGGHVQALTDGRWVQINELRTSEGGIVGIYTDITDVKAEDARQRTRELAERNLILQATLDNLSEGVCLFAPQGQLAAWNEAAEKLLGLRDQLGSVIADHEAFVAHSRTVLALEDHGCLDWRGTDGGQHVVRLCKAGTRSFELRSTALDRGGLVIGFTDVTDMLAAQQHLRETAETLEVRVAERTEALQAEVTERRLIEAQLLEAKTAAEKANLSKTSFLAAASHDLLQPLNAARLFVAALGDRRLALPTRALVNQTSTALDSVEDLLEALLEISRLDAGAIQPEVTALRVDRLLATLELEFAPLARAAGLTLRINAPPLWVRSDIRLLRRILQNFLSNALRYTLKGGVSIECVQHGQMVRISVSDTGPGIARDKQALIFEEFRRLDSRIAGKGLGLAIVKRASDMLGHTVSLESAPGNGATFSIALPLGQALPEELDSTAQRGRDRSMRGLNVLVIDNERQIQAGMRTLMTGWGCSVVTVDSYAEAAAHFGPGERPDVMLVDYHLKDGERGDNVIARLDGYFGVPTVPAIMISADRSEELKAKLAAQAIPLLNKPVKPAQLRSLLRTMLR